MIIREGAEAVRIAVGRPAGPVVADTIGRRFNATILRRRVITCGMSRRRRLGMTGGARRRLAITGTTADLLRRVATTVTMGRQGDRRRPGTIEVRRHVEACRRCIETGHRGHQSEEDHYHPERAVPRLNIETGLRRLEEARPHPIGTVLGLGLLLRSEPVRHHREEAGVLRRPPIETDRRHPSAVGVRRHQEASAHRHHLEDRFLRPLQAVARDHRPDTIHPVATPGGPLPHQATTPGARGTTTTVRHPAETRVVPRHPATGAGVPLVADPLRQAVHQATDTRPPGGPARATETIRTPGGAMSRGPETMATCPGVAEDTRTGGTGVAPGHHLPTDRKREREANKWQTKKQPIMDKFMSLIVLKTLLHREQTKKQSVSSVLIWFFSL